MWSMLKKEKEDMCSYWELVVRFMIIKNTFSEEINSFYWIQIIVTSHVIIWIVTFFVKIFFYLHFRRQFVILYTFFLVKKMHDALQSHQVWLLKGLRNWGGKKPRLWLTISNVIITCKVWWVHAALPSCQFGCHRPCKKREIKP